MSLSARSSKLSEVEMTEMVMPQHSNPHGTVFGGVITSWIDMAAGICSMRHTSRPMVTAAMDAVHFLKPIRQGFIVIVQARINQTWNTSCEVGVKITAENPITGERHHTTSAYLTMVALDSLGKPMAIPPVFHELEIDIKRQQAAADRRAIRLALKELQAKRHPEKK